MPNFKRIAVLRAGALGDLLFAMPTLSALRKAMPDAEIVLLSKESHRQLLADRPCAVDRVEALPAIPGVTVAPENEADGAAADELVGRLWSEHFDLAVQIHGGGRYSNPFVRKLGAGLTCGLRTPDAEPLDLNVPYIYYQPEIMRCLEVVGQLGVPPAELAPEFPVIASDRAELEPIDLPRPLVAVHPGATDSRRRWAPDRFAAVADAVADSGASVVLTGAGEDREQTQQVQAAARTTLIDTTDQLSVGGLAALYERCDVVVSNDTGPLHLAAAVGTAAVGIFWCGNMINAALPMRRRYRPQISWTIHCPVCEADCTRDLYPDRAGGEPCDHRVSFVDDVSTPEVIADTLDLLKETVDE